MVAFFVGRGLSKIARTSMSNVVAEEIISHQNISYVSLVTIHNVPLTAHSG